MSCAENLCLLMSSIGIEQFPQFVLSK